MLQQLSTLIWFSLLQPGLEEPEPFYKILIARSPFEMSRSNSECTTDNIDFEQEQHCLLIIGLVFG